MESLITEDKVLYAPYEVEDQPVETRVVPSKEELEANLATNRLDKQPAGRWATYIYNIRKKDAIANPDYKWIPYVPNSRYQYINRLLKKIGSGETISQPDIDFVSTFWMESNHRKHMLTDLAKYLDKSIVNRFTVVPTPQSYSKSFRPYVTPAGLRMIPANPGIHNIEDDPAFIEYVKKTLGEESYNRLSQGVHDLVVLTLDKYGHDKDAEKYTELDTIKSSYEHEIAAKPSLDVDKFKTAIQGILQKILAVPQQQKDEYGLPLPDSGIISFNGLNKYVQRSLLQARRALNTGQMSIKELQQLADGLATFKKAHDSSYLMSLLDPWRVRDAKIPDLMPIPTASFKIRSTITLTTNGSGNIAFCLNPYFLIEPLHDTLQLTSTFGVNNNVSLTGTGSNNNFVATNIGQVLPQQLYKNYRLVSAAVRMIPVGSTLTSSGFITGGLDLDGTFENQGLGTNITDYAQYGSFQTIENLYYHHSEAFSSGKTVQVRWVPKDKSATDYRVVMATTMVAVPGKNGGTGKLVGYGQGLPQNSPCLKLDYVANFEALVTPANFDYLPTSFYKGSYDDYETAMRSFTPGLSVRQSDLTPEEIINQLESDPTLQSGKDSVEAITLPPREDSPAIISQLLGGLKTGLGKIADQVPWASLANTALTSITGLPVSVF